MLYYGLEWHSLDSYFQFKEQSSAPGTPTANELRVYAKDKAGTSALYYKNDAGSEIDLSGGLTGTGTANRLAYWTSALALAANAALTPTHVLFADANGLPTGDSNLVWNNTAKHLVLPFSVGATGGQLYTFTNRSGDTNILAIQSQNSAVAHLQEWYSKDGDGTDNVGLNVFGKGTPSSVANRELFQLYYDAAVPEWKIVSDAGGTGTVRPIKIYTGANTNQLVLATSGNVGIGGSPTQKLEVVGNVLISGLGNNQGLFLSSAGLSNLEVVDGGTDWVFQTSGFGTQLRFDGLTLAFNTGSRGNTTFGNSVKIEAQADNSGLVVARTGLSQLEVYANGVAGAWNIQTNGYGSVITLDGSLVAINSGSGANVGINDSTPDAQLDVVISTAAKIGQIVQAAASQSANILELHSSASAVLFQFDASGFPKWVSGKEQTTVGAAGAASALPANPTKYLQIKDSAGTTLVIPAYAAA